MEKPLDRGLKGTVELIIAVEVKSDVSFSLATVFSLISQLDPHELHELYTDTYSHTLHSDNSACNVRVLVHTETDKELR